MNTPLRLVRDTLFTAIAAVLVWCYPWLPLAVAVLLVIGGALRAAGRALVGAGLHS